MEQDRYLKLVRELQDWCMGAVGYGSFAPYLGMSTLECYTLLARNGLADISGKAMGETTPQDVINLVLLSGSVRLP